MAIPGIPISDRYELGNSLSSINDAFIDIDQKLSTIVTGGGGTFTGGITATNATFTQMISSPVIRGYGGYITGLIGVPGAIGEFYESVSAPLVSGVRATFTSGLTASTGTFVSGLTAPTGTFTNNVSAPNIYGSFTGIFAGDGSRIYNLTSVPGLNTVLPLSGGSVFGSFSAGDTLIVSTSAFSPTIVVDTLESNYDPLYNNVILLTRNDGSSLNPSGVTGTIVGSTGTAGLSTKYIKFNKSSLYFDASPTYGGTNRYIGYSGFAGLQTNSLDFTGNFVAEFWVYVGRYPNTSGGTNVNTSSRCAALFDTISRSSNNTSNAFCLGIKSDGNLIAFVGTTPTTLTSLGAFPLARWTHVAIRKISSSVSIVLNGSSSANLTISQILAPDSAVYFGGSPRIDSLGFIAGEYGLVDTAFSDVRITIGGNRYPSIPFDVSQPFPYYNNREINRITIDSELAVNNNIVASRAVSVNENLEILGNTSSAGSLLSGSITTNTSSITNPNLAGFWSKCCVALDGRFQAYVGNTGNILVTRDYGNSFVVTGLSKSYTGITAASNGSVAYAAVNGEYIYKSIDLGTNWTSLITEAGIGNYREIATTSSGSYVIAAVFGSRLKYNLASFGSSWFDYTTSPGTKNWTSVAVSDITDASGVPVVMIACATGEFVYVTNNSGSTWTAVLNKIARTWAHVKVSSNGKVLVAIENSGTTVYISKDYGLTWAARTIPTGTWSQIAISNNGSRILISNSLVGGGYGAICSVDTGDTWRTISTGNIHTGIAMLPDGSNWFASYTNNIFKYTPSGGNLFVKGKIGIGTTTPNKELTVVGEISATSTISAGGLATTGLVSSGQITSSTGTFTTSVSAPALSGIFSGIFYGDGKFLTNVISPTATISSHGLVKPDGSTVTISNGTITANDPNKLPTAGGNLTGRLLGTIASFTGSLTASGITAPTGTFTTSVSAPALSGMFYGNGSFLTNVIGTDPNKLPLAGGTLNGDLFGTTASFTQTLSARGNANVDGGLYSNSLGVIDIALFGNQTNTTIANRSTLRLVASTGGSYIQSGQNTTTGSAAALIFTSINNANEWMRIASDGKVGIGVTAPETILDVSGSAISSRGDTQGYVLLAPKNGTSPIGSNYDRFEIQVSPNTQVTFIGNAHSGTGIARALGIKAGNLEHVRITTTGNVGIGTTTPSTKLHVVGDSTLAGTATIGGNTRINGTLTIGRQDGGGVEGGQIYLCRGSDDTALWALDLLGAGNAPRFRIHTDAGGEKLTILDNGNVGIGTPDPTSRLMVVGNINSTTATFDSVSATRFTGSGNDLSFSNRFQFPYFTLVDFAGNNSTVSPFYGTGFQNELHNIALDASGNLWVSDTLNHTVKRITFDVTNVTTVGTDGQAGYINGTGAAARFNNPRGVCVAEDGFIYVADSSNHVIRRIHPSTFEVTLVAGTVSTPGYVEGTATTARFNNPSGITSYRGSLYVADYLNHRIRKIDTTASNVVSTFAGNGVGSNSSGTLTSSIASPWSIAVDAAKGEFFVFSVLGYLIRRLSISQNSMTTIAGTGSTGSSDGVGTSAAIGFARQLTVGLNGDVYFADSNSGWTSSIRRLTLEPNGSYRTTTISGYSNTAAVADGPSSIATFGSLNGIAIDSKRNIIYVGDGAQVRRIQANTNYVSYDSTGIVNAPYNASFTIKGATLGQVAGNTANLFSLTNSNGNVNYLNIFQRRGTNGTSWETASTRIQAVTDVTSQAYMEFNPPNGTYGIAFGTGTTPAEVMRITSGGNVGIGTNAPSTKLTVNGTVSATAFSGSGASLVSLDRNNISNFGHTHSLGDVGGLTDALSLKLQAYPSDENGNKTEANFSVLANLHVKTVTEVFTDLGGISTASLTLNLTNAAFYKFVLNTNITSLTFGSLPLAISQSTMTGKAFSFVLQVQSSGVVRTIVWPTAVKWPANIAPTLTSTVNKIDTFSFLTWDGGTTWFGFVLGQNQ